MTDRLIFVVLAAGLVFAWLGWRICRDRMSVRSQTVRAQMDAALRRGLGGESLVSIEAVASTFWRRGRVVLSFPAGWHGLIGSAWDSVIPALPAGYELVIRPDPGCRPTATR